MYRSICLAASFLSLLLTGCLKDKARQLVPDRAAVPPTVTFHTEHLRYDAGKPEEVFDADRNHATVEFLETGALADPKCRLAEHSSLCQRDYAVAFLQEARLQAHTKNQELTVLTFIHGNENNATEKTDNYPHFRQLIDCLNLGQGEYQKLYEKELTARHGTLRKPDKHILPCIGFAAPGNRRYVGIFIGWRGKHTLSPANLRQKPAMHISSNPEIAKTLYQLRNAAKEPYKNASSAYFIVMGHSFGGLLLEHVAQEIYSTAYANPTTPAQCTEMPKPQGGLQPFTDLMVLINPAINAKPAQQFIQMLRNTNEVLGGKAFCPSSKLAGALVRPLVLNVVSKSDFWSRPATARVIPHGNVLRHAFGAESEWGRPDPVSGWLPAMGKAAPDPGVVYLTTPAMMLPFQNLCYIREDTSWNTGDPTVCDAVKEDGQRDFSALAVLSGKYGARDTGQDDTPERKTFDPWRYIYVRYNCVDGTSQDYRVSCSDAPRGTSRADLHVWNTTPYWLVAVDPVVIDGHDDFWNASFVTMVLELAYTFPVLDKKTMIATPHAFE